MLPVVYEKYNYLLSMNINAEIYKCSFTEKNFSKCAHKRQTQNDYHSHNFKTHTEHLHSHERTNQNSKFH
jgi:hypothetical protein